MSLAEILTLRDRCLQRHGHIIDCCPIMWNGRVAILGMSKFAYTRVWIDTEETTKPVADNFLMFGDRGREHCRRIFEDYKAKFGIVNPGEQRLDAGTPAVKVRCQKCQLLNDESAKFCNQCGSPI